jgi:3-oxoacyl-ACP reductase-like protein
MHLLTSLILISGFVFVYCLRVVKVIWDLSEMSAHVPPMPARPCGRFLEAEQGHANATEVDQKGRQKIVEGREEMKQKKQGS